MQEINPIWIDSGDKPQSEVIPTTRIPAKPRRTSKYEPHYGKQAAERNLKRLSTR